MKSLSGIVIASSIGAFISTFAMCLTPEVASHQFLGVLFTYSLVGAIFGVTSGLLFGWPITFLFQRFNLAQLWHFVLGGFVCALPFWTAWFYPFNSDHWDAYKYSNSVYFFSVGILSGVIYWHLVVRVENADK